MRKILFIFLTVLCLVFIGCSAYEAGDFQPTDYAAPRMIISGHVTNSVHEPLPGIYVSVPSVREPNERDILSYNYAITDNAGQYTIIRYRGRELPTEVTVVATDSTGLYSSQYIFAPVTYDSIQTYLSVEPYRAFKPFNAYVEADFVLTIP